MWPYKTGDLLKEVQFICNFLWKDKKNVAFEYRWPLNRGDHMDRFDKRVIRICKSRNSQHNGKKKKDKRTNNDLHYLGTVFVSQTSSKSALQVFHLRGAWHPLHTLFTMISEQAFHIITWHTTIKDHTPYPPPQQILGSCVNQDLTTVMNLQ